MSEVEQAKLVIIGSGPAGLTAAIYASRAGLAPVVFTGIPAGGQLMITTDVENYPGFPEGVMGPELMDLMRKQAERFGSRMVDDNVGTVDLSRKPFTITGSSGKQVRTPAVIVATGASAIWLNVPGEELYKGRGLSACATCDGFFFKGKEVVVVGGGDTAMEEATFLTRFATKVTVIHRRDSLRASKAMQERARANPKITVVWNTVVEAVLGDGKQVNAVRLKNLKENRSYDHPTGGVFVAIGHTPNTDFLKGQLKLMEKGYLYLQDTTRTSVDGVFGCGDVSDHRYRQAVSAAGMGCMAAMDAEKWLEEHHQG